MKQLYFFLLLLLTSTSIIAQKQSKGEKAILHTMDIQEKAWNSGDIEAFMDGYWRSDSLKFIGSKGLTYGWQSTLDNYHKSYPDRAAMGKLTFTIISVEKLSSKSAFVIGKWHLARQAGDLSGHYTLLWKRIKGKWLIVADHSS